MIRLLGFALLAVATMALVQPTLADNAMACEKGPLKRDFGKSQWLVYGCADHLSLAFVSRPGSPAFPFYFFLSVTDGAMHLTGEGTGSKAATDAAYQDLTGITDDKRQEILDEIDRLTP